MIKRISVSNCHYSQHIYIHTFNLSGDIFRGIVHLKNNTKYEKVYFENEFALLLNRAYLNFRLCILIYSVIWFIHLFIYQFIFLIYFVFALFLVLFIYVLVVCMHLFWFINVSLIYLPRKKSQSMRIFYEKGRDNFVVEIGVFRNFTYAFYGGSLHHGFNPFKVNSST